MLGSLCSIFKPFEIVRLLVTAGELRLGAAQEVGDEVGLAADVDMVLVRAAAEALVQGGAVALLLSAVQLAHQDVVCPQHLVLTVGAEPADGGERGSRV